jgi:glycosyltransferase involved in cell wall biosynthesis
MSIEERVTPADDPREAELLRHFEQFDHLASVATGHFGRGRHVAAAAQAQAAASYAYFHHPGLWTSPRLERMLLAIGRQGLPRSSTATVAREEGRPVERVLHVLTKLYSIGGHSRMVWRWISQDDARRHSVVITRQGPLPVPPEIVEAAESRGGEVRVLNRRRGNALSWSRQLRALAHDFDLVVMHLFAEDVIPVLAFADRRGLPRVAFVDQADHAFSLGAATSDVYIPLRRAGADLAVARRGVAPERVAELPIVVPKIEREHSRAEAKRLLGLATDDVVVFSVARAPKYRTYGGEHFTAPFRGLVERHPRLRLIVVGPEVDEAWQRAADESAGRIRAYGERPDTKTFYEAADIYVDSFPAVSNTSLLEAGGHGLPLVSRCVQPGPHTIYCADSPGFANHIVRANGPRELAEALERLVVDEAHRVALGEQTRAAIEAAHVGAGWLRALEQVYEQARRTAPLDDAPSGPDVPLADDVDLRWSEFFGNQLSVADIRSYFVKGLPPAQRLRAWFEISAQQRRVRPQLLVPEWATAHAREIVTRLRRR